MLKREVILPEEQLRAEVMPRPPGPPADELPAWVYCVGYVLQCGMALWLLSHMIGVI